MRRDSGTAWKSSPALAIAQLFVHGCTCSIQENLLITVILGAALTYALKAKIVFHSSVRNGPLY